MTLQSLLQIMNSGEIEKLKSTLEVSKFAYFISDSFTNAATLNKESVHYKDFKEYNPKQHKVHDPLCRLDKVINGPTGAQSIVKVTRLSIPEQKKIVLLAATFLGSPELTASPSEGLERDFLNVIEKIGEDNKINYKFMEISKRTMSERECAELWYVQPAEPDFWDGTPMAGNKYKLRMRVLSPALGDTLFPVWDEYGDMIAFCRYYETVEASPDLLTVTDNKIYHFDVYTADRFYFMTKTGNTGTWGYDISSFEKVEGEEVTTTVGVPNPIKKIPVIYYSQPTTEWADVQEMIDRLEKKLSNHADTNDYFDSPIIKAIGKVEGFADKGEQGKLLEILDGGDVSYLTWDNAPESMRMEIENLRNNIHTYTHTPNISFENIKGLGNFSGIALKMFFMDAHLKASEKEELFGQGVQRRINYLKAGVVVLDEKFKPVVKLKITPVFKYFLPRDVGGEVDTLVKAYQAGIISLESAVKLNPLVEDAVSELQLIKNETEAANKTKMELLKNTPPPPAA